MCRSIPVGLMAFAMLAAAAPVAEARTPAICEATTPKPGSALRKTLLDALRPQVEQLVGRRVEFGVREVRVACAWARVRVDPRSRGGGDHYEPVDAIFRKKKGVWILTSLACTEADCPPAAKQYRDAYFDFPKALSFP